MGKYNKLAAIAAAIATFATAVPAQAQITAGEASQLRKLDIMLMVSSLRCRFGVDDFQADYAQFSTNQNATMQAAFAALKSDFSAQVGTAGAKAALDTMSVSMANQYGQGHPWLGCAELKAMAQSLAATGDRAHLLAVANDVLGDRPPVQLATVGY